MLNPKTKPPWGKITIAQQIDSSNLSLGLRAARFARYKAGKGQPRAAVTTNQPLSPRPRPRTRRAPRGGIPRESTNPVAVLGPTHSSLRVERGSGVLSAWTFPTARGPLWPPHVGAFERSGHLGTSSVPHLGAGFSRQAALESEPTNRLIILQRNTLRRPSGMSTQCRRPRRLWGRGQRRQRRGSGSQPGGDLSSPESGPVTRHIFAGSKAGETRGPGRAGPRRLRPPASAPSYPAASGAAQTRGAEWGSWVPTWWPGTQLEIPVHPTHARGRNPTPQPVAFWGRGQVVGLTTPLRPYSPHRP